MLQEMDALNKHLHPENVDFVTGKTMTLHGLIKTYRSVILQNIIHAPIIEFL
jgi:hypothetical protein